jgi:LPS-assembly protein
MRTLALTDPLVTMALATQQSKNKRNQLWLALAPALALYVSGSQADALPNKNSSPSLYRCEANAEGTGWDCGATPNATLVQGTVSSKPNKSKQSGPKADQRKSEPTVKTQGLDWQPLANVPANQRDEDCIRCGGRYLEPDLTASASAGDNIKASAENSETTATGSVLSGDVLLTQGSRRIQADQVIITTESESLELKGHVMIREPGVLLQSEAAVISRADQTANLSQAEFVLHNDFLHGRAKQLEQTGTQSLVLTDSAVSYCAPGDPTWELYADKLELDAEAGIGRAEGAKLKVKDTTVLALPNMSFPVGDKRKSGVLWPSISNDSENGLTLAVPLYANLAPNYDLLYTPMFMQDRGFHQTLAGRYLSKTAGQVELELGYIDSDDLGFSGGAVGENRWHINLTQKAQYNDNWSSQIQIARISDPNYLRDLDSGRVNSRYQDQLSQEGYLRYQAQYLDAQLSVRKLQSTALDLNDTYASLPQLEVSYRSQNRLIEPVLNVQWTDFSHSNDQAIQGERTYTNAGLALNWQGAGAYAKAQATFQDLSYKLDNMLPGIEDKPTASADRFVLDAGLYFDRRALTSRTTLSPTIYYVNNQSDDSLSTPLFDTRVRSAHSDAWFKPSLTVGHDRLLEENRVTAAIQANHVTDALTWDSRLAYLSFIDTPAEPLLNTHAMYQYDELIGFNTEAQWASGFSASLDVIADAQSGTALNQFAEVSWNPSADALFSVGYSKVDTLIAPREQWHVSGAYRLSPEWRVLFAGNVDTRHNANLETLLGLEYDSCCWRVRVVHSQYQDVPNGLYYQTEVDWREEQQVQIEVVLKGLGGFGQAIDSTLNQLIRGFHEATR